MKKLAILSSLFLSIGAAVQAQDTTYDWTGGATGFTGQIVLDSPSSSGGSLSDVVSIDITTPGGSFALDPSAVYVFYPIFTWNSSQITSMAIYWNLDGGTVQAGVEELGPPLGNFVASEFPYYIDSSGSWTAAGSVPDAGSTFALFGAAICGLGLLRRSQAR